jgi:hypothetical protein
VGSRTHFEDPITESLGLSGEDTQTSGRYDNIDMYRRRAIDLVGRRDMQSAVCRVQSEQKEDVE